MKKLFLFLIILIIILIGAYFYFFNKKIDIANLSQGCIDNSCKELLIGSKDKNHTIDILFIGTDKYNDENFIEDLNNIINTLFSIEPFDKNKNKFNIYYYNKRAKCDSSKELECYIGDIFLSYPYESPELIKLGKFDIYALLNPSGGGTNYGGIIYSSSDSQTFIHELAHSFQIHDEYVISDEQIFHFEEGQKSTNICSNYSLICCGGKICSDEIKLRCKREGCRKSKETECCIPIKEGSNVYHVPYSHIMIPGKNQDMVFSEAIIKLLDYKISNWEDVYAFRFEEAINSTVYIPDYSRKDIYLEDIS